MAFKNHQWMSIFSSGIEDNPTVFYKIIRGSTDQTNKYDTFYLQQRKEGSKTYADIKVNHPLDYERIKEYNLTVRVEVSDMNTYVFEYLSMCSNCSTTKGQLISNVLLVPSFWPKNQRNFFKNFGPRGQIKKIKALYYTN